jgi:hypothetical protein
MPNVAFQHSIGTLDITTPRPVLFALPGLHQP